MPPWRRTVGACCQPKQWPRNLQLSSISQPLVHVSSGDQQERLRLILFRQKNSCAGRAKPVFLHKKNTAYSSCGTSITSVGFQLRIRMGLGNLGMCWQHPPSITRLPLMTSTIKKISTIAGCSYLIGWTIGFALEWMEIGPGGVLLGCACAAYLIIKELFSSHDVDAAIPAYIQPAYSASRHTSGGHWGKFTFEQSMSEYHEHDWPANYDACSQGSDNSVDYDFSYKRGMSSAADVTLALSGITTGTDADVLLPTDHFDTPVSESSLDAWNDIALGINSGIECHEAFASDCWGSSIGDT